MSQKLDELLLRWEDRRRTGKPASVEELCRDCPDLREQLQAKVQALERMDQILNLNSVRTQPTNGRPRTRYDDLRPNQEPVPGYRLEKRLGKGGFGEVWKAIGPGGFAVALKFVSLNGHLGASEVRSLDVIKTVHHPNLLATVGSWQTGGFLVIAMELADRTLLDRLNEAVAQGLPGIPRDELIRYMQDAAKGIDYLNQPDNRTGDNSKATIQHRDIKPQNILLMGGGIKIGDFGLLRILKTTVNEQNGSLTLAYAAPEFLNGHAARSSDQYSLAVTYCHLRGGRLPFVGHAGQVMEGHLKHAPDLSMLPEAEQGPIARALQKDPRKRWPTCGEFIGALGKCHDSKLDIRPGRSLLRWLVSRRIRIAAALAVVFLVGVVAWSLLVQFQGNGDTQVGKTDSNAKTSEAAIPKPPAPGPKLPAPEPVAERGTQFQPTDPNFQIPRQVKKNGNPLAAFTRCPSGSAWTFTGGVDLQGNGSLWGYSKSPIAGTNQTACFQHDGSISQSFAWSSGSHKVSVWLQQRPGGYGNLPVSVLIDGVTVATFTPTGTWTQFTTPSFTISTPGDHQLMFSTKKANSSGGDPCTGIVGVVVH